MKQGSVLIIKATPLLPLYGSYDGETIKKLKITNF